MPSLLKLAAATLLLSAAPALADSPFDGTWKAQVSSLKVTAKPDVFSIKNGVYVCKTCQPSAYSVPADGKFHAVAGRPYWDEIAVTAVDDHNARIEFKKGGTLVSTNTDTVSADGMTLTTTNHNTNNGGNVAVDAAGRATRVGAPVAGAHLVSGSWQFAPATSVSDAALTMTLKVDGDRLHQVSGLGETLDATIGGAYAINQGDPGKTMTKAERAGPRALKLTDMRGGKVVQVATYTVSDDGTTLTGNWTDPTDGSTGGFTAMKQ